MELPKPIEQETETAREQLGYHQYSREARSQQMKKLREILQKSGNCQSKLPVVRIRLRRDPSNEDKIYRYKFSIAMELIRTGAATLVSLEER